MMGRDNRLQQSRRTGALMALVAVAALAGCGGGGGDGGAEPPPPPPPPGASCTTDVGSFVGVCTGFDSTNLDWSAGGDGSGGVGDGGATGDGGVGAGGDFGQFRNVTITVYRDDGTLLGSAPTDATKGMVTIRPGRSYRGGLRVELRGGPGAEYFEEGKNAFVPFPADRVIRVVVPRIDQNIGITPFTEAAYQMLTQGTAEESANTPSPTPLQIRAANNRVATLLNEHFPAALAVRDITRLPFIKSPSVSQGSFNIDERGIYGVVNGAFSKQAALFNTSSSTPTLDAVTQLSEDLRDGKLDGFNGNRPAATAQTRTYDPQTLTSELTAALAQQAERFGSPALRNVLPKLVNFGGTRYEGYLFDTSVTRGRGAVSTVAGWVAANTLNLRVGQANPKALPAGQSVHSMIGNMGHGGAFFKIDSTDTTATPVNRTYALGDNVNGELGTGNTTSTARQLVEVNLPGALTHAAGGFAHTVFRLGDGRVFAVGDNTYGQLGQGGAAGTPARAITPVEVPLPAVAGGAVAVAATSVASYALMADGSVYAWGSGGGFGLLGDGQAASVQTSPALVAGLSEVVQISARDNDVIALRRDQSVLQWGSHPADPGGAYTDGDVTAPYRGGTFAPTSITGLPSETFNGRTRLVPVRKIISEQGLFGVLLANGHVYTWGVHFDLSAKAVLRDLNAARVLGVPPLRDMMPGGFVGYGARPFDRLVAMGVDYSGGMWKIRGRVAEFYDPDNPAQQRRPQTDQPRSSNCASCHTFLDQTLEQLRARQAAEAPVPGNAAVCQPPSSVHVSPNGLSFIRAETECILCHNPSRNDPRYAGVVAPAFAANGGWPNCLKPDNLPPRDNVPARPISNSCVIPPNHVFTPPGTVCSSCHNSVAARALQDLNPPCAQPGANELPSLAVTATIVSVTEDNGSPVAQGAYTRDANPQINGTLSAPLASTQLLTVRRNGVDVGQATASGTAFRFIDSAAPQGTSVYTARVAEDSRFGPTSNSWTVRVDNVPPSVTAQITALTDDVFGVIADGGFTTDTTPTLRGTLSGTPDAGDVVEVFRNGAIVGIATVSGTNWVFAEPAALPAGNYTWQVRLIDPAANATAFVQRSASVIAGLPGASITGVVNDGGTPIAAGSYTSDRTPSLSGSIAAALSAGQSLRVLRNGAAVGTATVSGTSWQYTDTAPEGAVSYTARVEAGAVVGTASGSFDFTVDSIVPTQVATVTQISDDFVGALANPGTTADQTPTVSGTLSAALGSGERIRLRRTTTATGTTVDTLLTPTGLTWSYTETALVPAGTYTYQTQVFDLAANATGFTTARTVTIDPTAIPLPGAAATISTINGITPTGAPASIGLSSNPTPTLAGTLQRALNAGEVVRVFRNSAPLPTAATVTGTNWSFTNSTLADGGYTFTARVEQASNSAVFGQTSASAAVTIDATAPTQTIAISGIFDDSGTNVVGNSTLDRTPTLSGTLSAAVGPGETLQVTRTGGVGPAVTSPVSTSGQNWTFTEPTALPVSPPPAGVVFTYSLRVRDATGNLGLVSASVTMTLYGSLPSVTVSGVTGATGGFVNTTTPTITGSVGSSLPVGAVLRVYRGTTTAAPVVGNATFSGLNWSITDANVGQGLRSYVARVEIGTALGTVSAPPVSVTVDSIPPNQTVNVAQVRSDYAPTSFVAGAVPLDASIANGSNTNDATPVFRIALNAVLGSGESIEVQRGTVTVPVSLTQITTTACGAGAAACYEFPAPTAVTVSTNMGSTTGLPAPGTPGTFQTMGSATFTARVIDQAQNTGPASAGYAVNVGYFLCSQQRASAAASAAPNPITHPTIGAGQNPAQRCSSCHSLVSPADPAVGGGTAAGNFVAVPVTNPLYWCRRPS
jgi:Bacterial Ig-like domain/Regulator of chromosome condensation (RCC1) repeat